VAHKIKNINHKELDVIVLIINGAPRAGKDTFIEILKKDNFVYDLSSIDWVKTQATALGWRGEKNAKGRAFLSTIKDACTAYNDMPFKSIIHGLLTAKSYNVDLFCTCIREPSEIQKLQDWCDENNQLCCSVWIRNTKAELIASTLKNTGDSQYMNYNYHYQIQNNSKIRDFRERVVEFIEWLMPKEVA